MLEDAIAAFAAHGTDRSTVIDGRRYYRRTVRAVSIVVFAIVTDEDGVEVDRTPIETHAMKETQ